MVVISKKPLQEYLSRYPEQETVLMRWYYAVLKAEWSCFADVKKDFNSTDGVGNGLYVFNVKGNHCRVVVRIIFRVRTVFIKFVGTHTEYDKLDISKL